MICFSSKSVYDSQSPHTDITSVVETGDAQVLHSKLLCAPWLRSTYDSQHRLLLEQTRLTLGLFLVFAPGCNNHPH